MNNPTEQDAPTPEIALAMLRDAIPNSPAEDARHLGMVQNTIIRLDARVRELEKEVNRLEIELYGI
jgi:hypothetical protein